MMLKNYIKPFGKLTELSKEIDKPLSTIKDWAGKDFEIVRDGKKFLSIHKKKIVYKHDHTK